MVILPERPETFSSPPLPRTSPPTLNASCTLVSRKFKEKNCSAVVLILIILPSMV